MSGQDLTGADLSRTKLVNTDLTGAIITGVNFDLLRFPKISQEQLASTANYQAKNLRGISLHRGNLTGWDLSGQNLREVDLSYAKLANADLSEAILTDADLNNADLSNANLHGVQIINTNLSFADLTNADLSEATIVNTKLYDSNFTAGADLSGAHLKNVDAWGVTSKVFESIATYNQWTQFRHFTPPSGATLVPSPIGDFDANDILDSVDIELLQSRIKCRASDSCWQIWPYDQMFDLEVDRNVDAADLRAWIELKSTFLGDADLNGRVEFSDFLLLSDNFGQPGSWSTGDFDTNGLVEFSDFLILSENFGRIPAKFSGVPEPKFSKLLILLLLVLQRRFRKASTI